MSRFRPPKTARKLRDNEAILRERLRHEAIDEYDRQLEEFRAQNEEIGFELLKMGMQMLAIAKRIIATLENKEVLDSKDIDLFLAIPSSIRSIATFASSGSDLAADGLLIRQLMEKLKEDGN